MYHPSFKIPVKIYMDIQMNTHVIFILTLIAGIMYVVFYIMSATASSNKL